MKLIFAVLVLSMAQPAGAQEEQGYDRQGEAPQNSYAAGTIWGQFHRNGYAQASTPLRGPEAGDSIDVQRIAVPGQGGTPTQMHISARYPDGSVTAWSTNLTHIIKARVKGPVFEFADALQINRRALDLNILWNMTLARGNKTFVPSAKTRCVLRFGEADPKNPMPKCAGGNFRPATGNQGCGNRAESDLRWLDYFCNG
jgi:hypothetical protein